MLQFPWLVPGRSGRRAAFASGGSVSPILIRPVREQLEHDRVIRLLQAKWKRKHDVDVNMGDERLASVKIGQMVLYPDLVITSSAAPRRLHGLVEVETGESVNNMEAMAQWAHFAKARAPFYLYVPLGAVEIARRLCSENQVTVTELWSYLSIGDQIRFTLVDRNARPDLPSSRADKAPRKTNGSAKAAVAKAPARKAPAAKPRKPAARARPAARPSAAGLRASSRPATKGASSRGKRAATSARASAARRGARPTKAARARNSRTQKRK
jgi:hypothetical protein